MINDLDEALRQLLLNNLQIAQGGVDITFEQPKREWSARLNRPTLNLYLHDLRENKFLRQSRPAWEVVQQNDDDSVTRRRRPVRLDLHYMITAWAAAPEDEHLLLARTLLVLFKTPELPAALLPAGMEEQPVPITLMADQEDNLRNPAELWSALDNELRPTIPLIVTVAMNPYEPFTDYIVKDFDIQSTQMPRHRNDKADEA